MPINVFCNDQVTMDFCTCWQRTIVLLPTVSCWLQRHGRLSQHSSTLISVASFFLGTVPFHFPWIYASEELYSNPVPRRMLLCLLGRRVLVIAWLHTSADWCSRLVSDRGDGLLSGLADWFVPRLVETLVPAEDLVCQSEATKEISVFSVVEVT